MTSRVIFFLLVILSFFSCSERFDPKKFDQVRKTAEAVNVSAKAGADYVECSALVERLAAEISALNQKMESAKERAILKRYSELLSIYREGLLLWRFKIEARHYKFIPAGIIYVGQEVEPLVEKYKFEVKSHVYAPTGQVWKSIPENSISTVWTNADSQMALIRYLGEN